MSCFDVFGYYLSCSLGWLEAVSIDMDDFEIFILLLLPHKPLNHRHTLGLASYRDWYQRQGFMPDKYTSIN